MCCYTEGAKTKYSVFMKCPECARNNSMVVETRLNDTKTVIKRRRKCLDCQAKFNTLEKLDSCGLMVKKRNNSKEPFNKEKILRGVKLALIKRPFDEQIADDLVADVEEEILKKGVRLIETREIGEIVMDFLKKLDEVAYLRFVSVYNDFENVESFEKELKILKK